MEAALDLNNPFIEASAPSPPTKNGAELKILCEKIRREASLTPPGVIDALCEGKPIFDLCPKAVYAEEVLEVARMLGRAPLVNFDANC